METLVPDHVHDHGHVCRLWDICPGTCHLRTTMEIRLKTCSVILGVDFCVHIIHHITYIVTIVCIGAYRTSK